MALGRDLLVLFGSAENLPALRRIYFSVIRLIQAELARAPFRPSPGNAAQIIRRVREIAQRINPRATSPVRKWINEEITAAFMAGDASASHSLEAFRQGGVVTGMADANRIALNSARGQVAEKLQSVYLQILQTAAYVVRRSQMVIGTSKPVTGGIVRTDDGRALAQDVADAIRLGDRSTERKNRLIAAGFAADLPLLFGLSQGYFLGGLKNRLSVDAYIQLVVEGLSRQAANKAVEIRSRQNDVHYNIVNRAPQTKATFDVCALFIGQVYYTGQGEDPLGFPHVNVMPGGSYLPQHPRCRHWFSPWDPKEVGPGMVARMKALSDLIPRRFLGMMAEKATMEVKAMSVDEIFAIAPMAFGVGAELQHPTVKGLAA